MDKKEWDIGEFVSYKLEEHDKGFRIVIEGTNKFKWLIASKIQEIKITEDDLQEYHLK
ncbi:hypothetical protein Tfer_1881 [Thermincola ferriacetica]|uniref:Uncharacterized protein n=1 Tax=Thermincola ferriacetica TaxID=281456 RepID=A0A0L6W2Z5_9FIRM|nr:hypothetical protein [Thermincola ferriacetica]KNZ69439.1 hypothetical protein Tfer_1881 [Thermincola ferriacetica]